MKAHEAISKQPAQYQDWMGRLGELTEGDPRIEELSGLEGWFTLPEDPGLARPPKYKMALATFLGVFPVAMGLNLTLGPAIRSWPFILSNAIFNACCCHSADLGGDATYNKGIAPLAVPSRTAEKESGRSRF